MKIKKNGILEKMLVAFGDIKLYKWPMFVVYDAKGYKIRGRDLRKIISLVRPGDILISGFDNYLDQHFVPGKYGHVGLYLGEVTAEDRELVNDDALGEFETGPQMMAHAIAEGILMCDILQFCRCDHLMIVRFPDVIKKSENSVPLDIPLNLYSDREKRLKKKLLEGETVTFDEVFPVVKQAALSHIGKRYDFNFDFADFSEMCCSEFVYFCTKALSPFMNIKPITKKYFGLFERQMILPDAFCDANLEQIYLK